MKYATLIILSALLLAPIGVSIQAEAYPGQPCQRSSDCSDSDEMCVIPNTTQFTGVCVKGHVE